MHEIFNEVVKEISVRKVEMKIKSKSRLNLFENENYTLFSINSFTLDLQQKTGQKVKLHF